MEKIRQKQKPVKDKKALSHLISKHKDITIPALSIEKNWLGPKGNIPEQYRKWVLHKINHVLKIQQMEVNNAIEL